MIVAAVLAAAVTVLAGGMWVGWWLHGDTDLYWSDHRAALEALAWIDQGGRK